MGRRSSFVPLTVPVVNLYRRPTSRSKPDRMATAERLEANERRVYVLSSQAPMHVQYSSLTLVVIADERNTAVVRSRPIYSHSKSYNGFLPDCSITYSDISSHPASLSFSCTNSHSFPCFNSARQRSVWLVLRGRQTISICSYCCTGLKQAMRCSITTGMGLTTRVLHYKCRKLGRDRSLSQRQSRRRAHTIKASGREWRMDAGRLFWDVEGRVLSCSRCYAVEATN